MIRKLTLTCIAWLCTLAVYSQCDLPAPAGPDCGSATFFCNGEVDGFCSTLPPNGNPAGPNPLCNGAGVPNNTEWIAFAAGTTSITFNITPSNCDIVNNGGQQFTGVQAGIYSDCSFSNALTCVGACQTNTFTLGATNFVIGQVYYIFLDGCAGSVCDYVIDVTSGSTVSPPPGAATGPTGQTAPCTNGNGFNVFTIPSVSFANLYDWTITPNVPFIQNGNMITVTDWAGATSVTICVEASNDCNPGPAGNEECTTFTINPVMPIDPPPGTYCENEGGYAYNGNFYQAAGSPYMINLLSPQGCDSTVTLNVIEYLNTDSQLDTTVCVGECVVIDGQPYCTTVNGIGIPVSTPNFRGCDSTVFLTLEILNPMVNITGDLNLDCGETETILFANVSNSPNTSYTWSYLWSTPNGSTNGIFDQNILLVNGPGDYEVEVTLETLDGVACTVISIPVTVTQTADIPTTTMSATDAPCSGAPSGTATATPSGGGGGPYTYIWDPTGQMSQTATNLSSGWYYVTVTSSNGCTTVDSVEVTTSAAVSLAVDNVVDVLCNGDATGSGTVVGSGGSPNYTYLWDPSTGGTGQTTATASGLTAGTYSVTITDAAGCTDEQTIMVIEPDALAFSSSTSPAGCDGDASGQAWVNPLGGTAGYTYLWDFNAGSQVTDTAFNLTAGLYSVTITDNNNCTQVINNIAITDPDPITLTPSVVDVLCNGESTGSATISPNGGTPIYTYLWNTLPAQMGATATNLPAGIYSVTVTDFNGCTEVQTGIVINESPAMTGSASVTDAGCNGTATGSISVTATGTGVLSYNWSGAAAGTVGPVANTLPAGTYAVTVTDANSCTFIISNIILGEPTLVTATISASQDILCFGESTGSATAQGGGGSGSYTYLWGANTGNAASQTVNNLPAGNYIVTITDGAGCTETATITLNEPGAALNITELGVVDASCTSNDGSIDIDVTGGTTGYSYLWTPGGSVMQDPQNLAGGSYTVVVTDANGCTAEFSTTVNIPGGLTASASATPLDCYGDVNADIDVTVNGGTGTLTYQWNQVGFGNNQDISSVGPGTYIVTITDANNCSVQTSVIITEPDSISIPLVQVTQASCGLNDGSIDLFVTGGTAGYTYNWTGAASPVANPMNLSAGPYTVTITDANGCMKDTTIIVTSPDGPVLSSLVSEDVKCNGEATGAINLDFSGGQAPFNYDWTGTAFDGMEDPVNVPAGVYDVTITDVNNCELITSVTVNEPTVLSAVTTTTDVLCNGENSGTATITPSGGTVTNNYTYLWCDGQVTQTAINCPAGVCSVTVTDDNGCTFVTDVTVNEPPVFTASLDTATPATCNGTATGSINLNVGGGSGGYTYAWTNTADPVINPQNLAAGFYDVTVTDLNGCTEVIAGIEVTEPDPISFTFTMVEATCNMDNGSISVIATGGNGNYTYAWSGVANPVSNPQNLPAGNYDLTITDMLGCTTVGQIEVATPSALSVQVMQTTDANCFGEANGSITLNVSGGMPGYTYAWTGGLDPVENPTGVPAGTYNVDITDLNGCIISTSAIVGEPPLLEISVVDVVAATCNMDNGSIDIDVMGGIGPYTYLWNTGDMVQDPGNLSPGLADVLVTDANGCTATLQIPVTEPGALAVAPTTVGVSCNSATDGSITLSPSGGNGPYSYIWSIPGVGNVNSVSNLAGGTYSAVVVDADGCQFPLPSLVIPEPDVLVQDGIFPTDASCLANDGSIDISFIGGTGNYTYSWTSLTSPFTSNQEDLTNLAPGEYQVVVTDANNCSTTVQGIMIDEPTPPTLTTDSLRVRCFGEANGGINVVVNNPNGAVNYVWSDPSIGDVQNPTGLTAGMYQVTVTDAESCVAIASIEVTEPDLLTADALTPNDVSCNGGNNGSATVTPMGGTPNYTYLWSNGDNVPDPGGLNPGSYTVVVTDANGCTTEAATTVTEPPLLEVSSSVIDARCDSESNGEINLTSSGGTGNYQFDWSDDQYDGLEDLSGLPAGTYLVTITDDNGCTETISAEVMAPPAVIVRIEDISDYSGYNVSCANEADGSITVQGTGGNGGPFTILWSDGTTTENISELTAGNYTVTVTDQLGCVEEESFDLTAPDPIVFSPLAQAVSCYGDDDGAIVIEDPIGGSGPYVYSLDDSPFGAGIFTALSAGNYQVVVQDANGCEEMQVISVQEPTEVVADLGGDLEIQLGDSIYLLAQTSATSLDTLYWTEGLEDLNCATCNGQWVTPTNTTTFGVFLEDVNGCSDDDQLLVRVRKDRLVYIPTGFSPTSTGGNNVFTIFGGRGVAKVNKFVIADRWGEIVYSALNFLPNDPDYGWDGSFKGESLNTGVFVYFAEIEFTDGRKEIFKGDVTLIK